MSKYKLEELSQVDNTGIVYIKAGFNRASSQSIYNQQYKETDLESAISSEESLLQTSIVPLKLIVGENEVWVNQRSSSSHFCRPLRLQYKKETKEISQEEETLLRNEIENLEDHEIDLTLDNGNHVKVKISFKVELTMLDGKVVNALTNTNSTQSCNVCSTKPSKDSEDSVKRKKGENKDRF